MRLFLTSIALTVIVLSAACSGDDTSDQYETVETWASGEGKAIVISPENVNDEDMTALGEQLNHELAGDEFAYIHVFDDREAAELRQRVASYEASDDELRLYDQHYVGQYLKDDTTGFNRFTIYLEGVGGTQRKPIDY